MKHKGVLVEYLLYDRHSANCLTFHFYVSGPSRGVPLEGEGRKEGNRLKWLDLQPSVWSSSTPVKKVGNLAHVSGTIFPSSLPLENISVRALLNYIIYIHSSWTSSFSFLWFLLCLLSFSCKLYFVCKCHIYVLVPIFKKFTDFR